MRQSGMIAYAAVLAVSVCVLAGEVTITGREEANLVCRNYFKPDHIPVDDLTYEAGGLDKGLPGDTDTIIMQRVCEFAARHQRPDILAIGLAAEKPAEMTVSLGLWCKQETWDFGALTVYWNDKPLGIISSNTGEKMHLEALTLKAPADAVQKENVLWLHASSYGAPVYLDAVKVSGDTALTLLDRKQTADLLPRVHPIFAEKRDLKGKGKVLALNEFLRTDGIFAYEVLKAMNADVEQGGEWVSPAKWREYRLVYVHGRWPAKEGDRDALGEYLEAGGTVVVTAAFVQFFMSGPGTAWDKLPWTGGYVAGWNKHAKETDRFIGIAAQDSPLFPAGIKQGAKIADFGRELSRFISVAPPDEKEVLVRVDSTEAPIKNQTAVFIRNVGKGRLIGVTEGVHPEWVMMLRNIAADALTR